MSHDAATAAAKATASRRSSRLSFSVPIVIHGKDTQQKAFRESTHTLIVNRHGAKLVTSQQLAIGAEILLENPTLGSVAKANVVWVSSKRDASGLHEAGVQLAESQNIWGIEFPPGDWSPDEEDEEATAAKEAPLLPPAPVESAPAKTPSPSLTSEEIATQILQDLHETADAHARQFRERLDQVVQRIGLEVEIDLRARAGAAKEKELAAIKQQISATGEHLRALKAQMEELDAKLTESRQSMGATLDSITLPLTTEQIHAKVEAEALPLLHLITGSGIGSARERFQAQVQADAGQALAAWRSNLRAERDSVLGEARKQFMMAVTSALETLNRERDAGLKEMKQLIQHESLESKETVALQIEEALSLLGPRLQEMQEHAVNVTLEAFRDRLSQFLDLLPAKGNE